MKSKTKQKKSENLENASLTYEIVNDNSNIVKVVSFDGDVKNEVYVMVLSEEQFALLLPASEKNSEEYSSFAST